MKIKLLILLLYLCGSLMASGIGVKAGLAVNDVGPGVNAGVFGVIDLGDIFSLFPAIDYSYISNNQGQYWNGHEWVYDNWGYNEYEIAFNIDGMFKFQFSRVAPYFGLGFAPVMVVEDYNDPYYESYTIMGAGVNLFGGIMFPLGDFDGIFEIRERFGSPYNMFKISFGILFGSNVRIHSYHRHRRVW